MSKILEFFKSTITNYKNLSPKWKKFISYIGVFILGVAITLTTCAFAYSGIRNSSREYADRVNKLIAELSIENKQLGETISGLRSANSAAEKIVAGLRDSESRQRQIISGLSTDNTRLEELNRRLSEREEELTRINSKLERENQLFREGNLSLDAANKRFAETIAALERIITESRGEHSELREELERALSILRRIQKQD